MLRVAWRVPDASTWMGGMNYYCNLARGLKTLSNSRIEPVLLGRSSEISYLNEYESIPYSLPSRYSISWFRSIFDRFVLHKESLLERLLLDNNIDLLSHYVPLGRDASVASLCWIPDLQHKRMPHFFSIKERFFRDLACKNAAQNAHGIVFSSENAREDFMSFYPQAVTKTYVLPFVAYVDVNDSTIDTNYTLAKYNICEPYFHVPNQLWKHKNHKVILDALKIAFSNKNSPLVISTGITHDYRHPNYFSELQALVCSAGLSERFRFLGCIPSMDLAHIMRNAIAIINPSYFEGWSTSVEEAKSIGKTVILSDIAVHREQNPSRGLFFDPSDPNSLYEIMKYVSENISASRELLEKTKAASILSMRMREYAFSYEKIVLDV